MIEFDVQGIKARIRALRAAAKLSQTKLAAKAGISKSVLEKYESRSNNRIPQTKQVLLLAAVYGVSTDSILRGTSH